MSAYWLYNFWQFATRLLPTSLHLFTIPYCHKQFNVKVKTQKEEHWVQRLCISHYSRVKCHRLALAKSKLGQQQDNDSKHNNPNVPLVQFKVKYFKQFWFSLRKLRETTVWNPQQMTMLSRETDKAVRKTAERHWVWRWVWNMDVFRFFHDCRRVSLFSVVNVTSVSLS